MSPAEFEKAIGYNPSQYSPSPSGASQSSQSSASPPPPPCPSCTSGTTDVSTNYALTQGMDRAWNPPSGVDLSVPAAIRDCDARVSADDVQNRVRCPSFWYPTQRWSTQTLDRAAGRTKPPVTLPFLMDMLPTPFSAQVLFTNWQQPSAAPCNTQWDARVLPFNCFKNEISLGGTDVRCLACLAVATQRNRTRNGEYAVRAMPVTPTTRLAYGDHTVLFKTCEPGTWNTCVKNQACDYPVQWMIPLSTGPVYQSLGEWMQALHGEGADISYNSYLGTLIGGCYPCSKAAQLYHYGEPMPEVPIEYMSKGYLPFWCPGGTSAPRRCATNMVAVIRATGVPTDKLFELGLASEACVCADGYKGVPGSGGAVQCVPCPPGYSCTARDGALPCPVGTFSLGGVQATACTPCTTDGCGDPSQTRARCTAVGSSTDARCVNCALCREFGCQRGCVDCQSVFLSDAMALA